MIYSFISLPLCPDPGRAKTCGSVRIRIRIRNPGIYTPAILWIFTYICLVFQHWIIILMVVALYCSHSGSPFSPSRYRVNLIERWRQHIGLRKCHAFSDFSRACVLDQNLKTSLWDVRLGWFSRIRMHSYLCSLRVCLLTPLFSKHSWIFFVSSYITDFLLANWIVLDR